jgi:3-phenylpropionate/cinnamic acid dioxygenase small subunit
VNLRSEIENFLYREARLLDDWRFSEWVELFTEDVRYWMPIRTTKLPKRSKAIIPLKGSNYDVSEVSKEDEMAYYDETKYTLTTRIARYDSGMAWAEDPQSRTRRLITNVEVEPEAGSEVKAHCNFLVYRHRLERDVDVFVGQREDVLRRDGESWKIAFRKIVLDQNILLAKNLSIFF